MSTQNYPRLLPPPITPANDGATSAAATHPIPPDTLAALSARLRAGAYTTSKEFIALCEYNINPSLEAELQRMDGSELQAAAAAVTLGIRRCQ